MDDPRRSNNQALRATPSGQWTFFESFFKQAIPPAQPDQFLAGEIERLRNALPEMKVPPN